MSPCLRQFIGTNVFKATSSVYIYSAYTSDQITWTWLRIRGKNDINTVRFLTQTTRFVS
ncbi:hypothetical protein PO909_008330 [Leuciscus waleckii]